METRYGRLSDGLPRVRVVEGDATTAADIRGATVVRYMRRVCVCVCMCVYVCVCCSGAVRRQRIRCAARAGKLHPPLLFQVFVYLVPTGLAIVKPLLQGVVRAGGRVVSNIFKVA